MRWRDALRSLLWLGLLLTTAGSARADFTPWQTVAINNPFQTTSGIYTDWFNGKNVNVLNPVTLTSVPYTVPTPVYAQFDPNAHIVNGMPGKLVGVELVMEYKFENTISLRFDNLSTLRVDVAGNMELTLPTGTKVTADFQGPNAPTTPGNPTPNVGQYLNTSGNITLNPGNMMSKTVDIPTTTIHGFVTSPPVTGFTDAATLAKFTGTSTVSLPILANASSLFSTNTGNGFGSSTTLASAVVSVRYLFVPEPSSVVLTGLGLAAGLVWVRRAGVPSRRAA